MGTTEDTDADLGDAEVPTQRPCTRCDGAQHLVGASEGFGKYRCETCEMVVGFDLDSEPPEFLLHRGLPSRYTQDRFGDRLLDDERRLAPREPQLVSPEQPA